ncbi:hypothetical protein [Nostoc sp. DSM 114167]|jgi:hypothetical protein|uniref:hypothetical protein n=1 Tax=Nostoc sp. DSM 114167 TaxID=3439050 RepID=UPI004045FD2C
MSHLNALSTSQKYSLWNRAIAEYFFSNNSNEQEIYLTISPKILAAAFAKIQVTPLSPEEAEQDFVDVVSSVYRHRVLSYSAGFSVLHGDDENGFPKYIAFLALCVLAAYRMHSDEEVSTGAYYPRLAELLGCKIVRNFPEGFHTDEFEKLWKLLHKWLKQKKSLLLAMSEANTVKKYISFPLTHVPLRQVDIEKLPNFFAWAGYTPGQIAPINKLEADILRWGSCYFTLTGKKALADKRLKAIITQVNNELELWDGAINDSYGRRSASVEILLDIVRRQPQFSFLPRCPDSFPSFFNCEELYLESSGEGWYNPISLGEKNGRDLREGFSWSTKSNNIKFVLQRAGCSAIALAPSSDYTGFVSRHSLPSGIACNVLVHEDVAKNAREYFEEISSRSSNPIHDKRLPDGWCLFRDIKAEKYVANIPSGLESLYVESAVDIVLSGGLRLGKKSAWLLGAPPRLMITGLQEGQQPKIDGIPITIAEDGTLVDLSHLMHPGVHWIEVGSVCKKIEIVEPEINFDKERQNFYRTSVTGSHVALPPGNWTIIGANPGEVTQAAIYESQQGIIVKSSFQAAWAIEFGSGTGARVVCLAKSPLSPKTLKFSIAKTQIPSEIERWTSLVYNAAIRRPKLASIYDEEKASNLQVAWKAYMQAAREIKRQQKRRYR